MDMVLNRPAVLFALLASLLLALLYALWGDGGGAVPGVDPVGDPAAAIAGRSGGLSLQGAGSARRMQASVSSSTAFPAAPVHARPQGLGEAFEAAEDLHAFVHRLLPAAMAGDAGAAWMVSRVYDYCAAHATDPAGFARDTAQLGRMGLTTSASMVAARERMAHRCRQFAPIDGIDRELVLWYRVEAAEAGSLAAEAALLAMGEPLDEEADYRRDLVDRVQASGDPEAFSALAPAMGLAASGDPAYAGQMAGTPMAELAWQLGACALGLDCAQEGALMTSYCANGGICSRDARQDFPAFVHDSAVPRRGRNALDEMVGSLLGEGVPR
ncbi:hypothetical protein ACW7G2_04070 [Luteimonas sp. A277]